MNVRLALTSAPVSLEQRYGSFVAAASTEPSFALVCLGAVAQRVGVETEIVEAASANLDVETTARQISSFRPDALGITATTVGITAAAKLAERVKGVDPSTLTVVGGCHASALPEQTLTDFKAFDIAVIGEGEETLLEILKDLERGVIPTGIEGTAIREKDGQIKVNTRRQLIQDLDSLPLPAWSLLEGFPHAFHPSPARIRRWPCASVVLTRGCPNQCTFCDRSVFGNRCRSYSPAYAANLIEDLRKNFGVKEILIEDDTFVTSRTRVVT